MSLLFSNPKDRFSHFRPFFACFLSYCLCLFNRTCIVTTFWKNDMPLFCYQACKGFISEKKISEEERELVALI